MPAKKAATKAATKSKTTKATKKATKKRGPGRPRKEQPPQPKRANGRPKGSTKRTLDEDLLKQVEAMSSLGLTAKEIALVLDLGERTVYRWQVQYPEFLAAIEKGRAKGHREAANTLREQSRAGNVAATIFRLKAQYGWRDKQEIEHSTPSTEGPGRFVIEVVDNSKPPPDAEA